jgi:hypothetical protein
MFTLFYTVAVRANFVWLVREPHSWRIGKRTKSGKLQLFSKKTELFLDDEDLEKIRKVLVKSEGHRSRAARTHSRLRVRLPGQDDRERTVGGVDVLFVRGERDVVSIRAGGHDLARFNDWTEFATWNLSNGIRFNKNAHPVFRKDKDALGAAAAEVAGGSGVFSPQKATDDTSIFTGQHLTDL